MLRKSALSSVLFSILSVGFWAPPLAASERFIPLNNEGKPLATGLKSPSSKWSCTFDNQTGLIWEVKTRYPGLHNRNNTYSWFNPDPARNGGLAGYPGGAECRSQPCDTKSFIERVNKTGWCNAHDWRLPTREELRSLVAYQQINPRPKLDNNAFPNAVNQFYWSSNTSATNPDEAWGVGFTFGFDYTYYKENRVHIRLVRRASSTFRKE